MNKESPGFLIGIDVGGTNLRVVLASADGKLLQKSRASSSFPSAEELIKKICSSIERLLSKKRGRLLGIGLGVAGVMDQERGEVLCSPHLHFLEHTPFKNKLEAIFKVPVILENDANAATLAEYHLGAGRGSKNILYATLSTGIGGGLILDGKLYTGAHGGAGEIGHIVIDPDGPDCPCGKRGCLETVAAGDAIRRDAISRLKDGAPSLLRTMSEGALETITVPMVHQATQRGDKLDLELLKSASYYLALGLASLINIFDPERFVLGGGLTNMRELYLEPAIKLAREKVMCPRDVGFRFEMAQLGDDAGPAGMVILLREKLHPD